jgi:thioesterase domain-containing protein
MAWQLEQQGKTVAFLGILPVRQTPINPMADDTQLNWLSDIVLVFEDSVFGWHQQH